MSPNRVLGALALGIGCICATHAAAGPGALAKPALIEVQGDRLTGHIAGVPLRQVLAELRRRAGIQSELIDPADDDAVSETFRDLPLDEAISRLLNGRSFLLYRERAVAAPGASASAPSLHLVILPRTRAPTPTPGLAPTAIGLDEAARAMVDPDENVRARAQEHFDRALATQQESAAGTAPPRR